MKSRTLSIELRTTALVVLDLQPAIVSLPLAPHAGKHVVTSCAQLTESFRGAASTVILVRLGFSVDGRDRLAPIVDAPLVRRQTPAGKD